MPLDPPRPAPSARPAWRLPVLIVAVCLLIVAVFWVTARLGRKERLGRRCFDDLLACRLTQAAAEFDDYRRLAGDDVPGIIRDDLFRLKANKDYPVYRDTADRTMLDRTVLLCLASARAVTRARNLQDAAIYALAYVAHNVASVPAPPAGKAEGVSPAQVLCRGYGGPVECAWLMAELLRIRSIHTALILLPASNPGETDYAIVGILMPPRLYLFDPYRAVPICRASDGRIADLQSLLSGRESLAPGFGGPGTPLTLERLRSAVYLVPAALINILPDGFLLNRILRENGRNDAVSRSFRDDLRNLAAAVFGQRTEVAGDFTHMTAPGRTEIVALWDYPFKLDHLLATEPDRYAKLAAQHRAALLYLNERRLHVLGARDEACQQYDRLLKEHAADAELVEDLTFFRAAAAPPLPDRAERLRNHLAKYPSSRWRTLAARMLLEWELQYGTADAAKELARTLDGTPYALCAGLFTEAASADKKLVGWRYPEPETPSSRPTTQPASSGK